MSAPAAAIIAIIVATIVVTIIYAIQCWLQPYARCWVCSGTGRGPSQRECRWCDGSQLRLRLGRRAFNHLYGLHRPAPSPRATARSRS